MTKAILLMVLGCTLHTAGAQNQPTDTTWTVRTDYITPAGQPDSSWTKEVNIVVNLYRVPALGKVTIKIGTIEGDSDLYNSETTLAGGQPTLPATVSNEGLLVIPAGQYTIDPEHFYVETLLFDTYNQPLNQ